MQKLYSTLQVKQIENHAINKIGIPVLDLMNNAGTEIFNEIINLYPTLPKNILIVCGKGNNGGDGLVIAQKFIEKGASPKIYLTEKINFCSSELKYQFKKIEKKYLISSKTFFKIKKVDLIIDAIFGISFTGIPKTKYSKIINKINRFKVNIISVDSPSGFNLDFGFAYGSSIISNKTFTIELPKIGLFINKCKDFVGEVKIVKIGIPKKSIDKINSKIFLIDKKYLINNLPKRKKTSHKYSVGKIFALCGSKGLTGAAILSTQSCMRAGAGGVILGIPKSEFEIVAKRTLEVMPFPLPSTFDGILSIEAFKFIKKKLKWCDVLLIGPGLSQNNETQNLIRKIISSFKGKIVIDADAIIALAGNLNILKNRKQRNIIITPHLGEFSKLINKKIDEIENNQIQIATSFSKKYKLTLVLKSSSTIISDEFGNVYVNPFGNSGMATAGSGDVLSGIISSFFAQGSNPKNSAICGVGIHSISGDIAKQKIGERSLIASDIIKYLPESFKI